MSKHQCAHHLEEFLVKYPWRRFCDILDRALNSRPSTSCSQRNFVLLRLQALHGVHCNLRRHTNSKHAQAGCYQ